MRTVDEVRVARLEQLIAEVGSVQAVAERMGKSHSQISQLKTMAAHSTTGKPRVIGGDLAREFEACFAKPRGWMDTDPAYDLMANAAQTAPMVNEPTPRHGDAEGALDDLDDLLPEDAARYRDELASQAKEAARLHAEIRARAEQMRQHRDYLLAKAGAKAIASAGKVANIPAAPPPKSHMSGGGAAEFGRPERGHAKVGP